MLNYRQSATAPDLTPDTPTHRVTLTALLERLRAAAVFAEDINKRLGAILSGLDGAKEPGGKDEDAIGAAIMPDGLLPDLDHVVSYLEERLSAADRRACRIYNALGL